LFYLTFLRFYEFVSPVGSFGGRAFNPVDWRLLWITLPNCGAAWLRILTPIWRHSFQQSSGLRNAIQVLPVFSELTLIFRRWRLKVLKIEYVSVFE